MICKLPKHFCRTNSRVGCSLTWVESHYLMTGLHHQPELNFAVQGMTPDRIAERKAKLAIWVREGLVKLGPTFIKIGQQFSTRVDVLSPEFVKELEKLQVSMGVAKLLCLTCNVATCLCMMHICKAKQ